MLALEVKKGEAVYLQLPDGRMIEVILSRSSLCKAKLAIEAPDDVKILRQKLLNPETVRAEA